MKRVKAFVAFSWLLWVGAFDAAVLAIENWKEGEALPAFSLPRADESGQPYGLEQMKGKPFMIVFWRPRQQLSLEALRDLQTITDEIGNEKFGIVAVDSARSTAQQVQTALAGETLSFPMLLDPQRALYGKVGVIVSPTTLVLDSKGILQFVLASHPRTYRQVIRARLRFLLGYIDKEQMNQEVEPTVLKIDHELAAAWRMYNLGRRLQTQGKVQEAFSVFEEALSRYPSLSEARCALGFMKFSEGDLETAAQHFQTALVHSPGSALARLGKAVVLARSGHEQQAEGILLSLLAQRSIAARVRCELGRIYQARGQMDRAVTFFQDALNVIFPEPPQGSTPPPIAAATFDPKVGPSSPGSTASPSVDQPPSPAATSSGSVPPTIPGDSATPSITPISPPADTKFTGVKSCKKCHFQQWKSWQDTKMAASFSLLEPGVRAEVKAARSLDAQKDYTRDPSCLSCHTTGFGFPGGYPETPPTEAREIAAAKELANVGCEACHGPGKKYSVLHKAIQDQRRKYVPKELFDSGQYAIGARVCVVCHNEKAPCIPAGEAFDFEKRRIEGTHKHYPLQFQTQ